MNVLRKVLIPVSVIAALIFGMSLNSASADSGPQFIQASSSITQTDGGVVDIDTVDEENGISFDGGTSAFTVGDFGAYLIIAAPQVGGVEGGTAKGEARFWLEASYDGGTTWEQLANSNVLWASNDKSDGDVIVSQGITQLEPGDQVRVNWATTGPAIEAIYPAGEPVVPAIIFSMARVGN